MWANFKTLWDEVPAFRFMTVFFVVGALVLLGKLL